MRKVTGKRGGGRKKSEKLYLTGLLHCFSPIVLNFFRLQGAGNFSLKEKLEVKSLSLALDLFKVVKSNFFSGENLIKQNYKWEVSDFTLRHKNVSLMMKMEGGDTPDSYIFIVLGFCAMFFKIFMIWSDSLCKNEGEREREWAFLPFYENAQRDEEEKI